MDLEAPGGSDIPNPDSTSESSVDVSQIDLPEKDDESLLNDSETAENVLDRLAQLPYQVFILSEAGRPIFVNSGNEEPLCALFAVIGIFVERVKAFEDSLISISCADRTIHFLHKPPLVFCIVSKYGEKLDEQLEVLYEQILSVLSRSQLESVYEKKGFNYDLRKLLRGTDRLIESSIASWRGSPITFVDSSISAVPMNPSDREFLSNSMANSLGTAKLDGALFGIMIAHRQIASYVRFKKYIMHPRDMNIVINLVSDKSLQIADAQTWTPICLPRFNDTGFFYAFISYPWQSDGIPACLVLLSVRRDHFDALNEVKQNIVAKLEGNSKFFANFSEAVKKPNLFNISQIGSNNESLWAFTYLNHTSKQVCISASRPPLISREERWIARCDMRKGAATYTKHPHLRTLFVRGSRHCLFVWVTDMFSLHCIFGPFVTAATAFQIVKKLLDTLKSHEQRYFIIKTASF
ncbi:unnamed protein product [Caenorhabditis bovis]|uniref:Vacuolar fusion protein MON1 homolog n=1 Tax=Caenorhabditis bovis TaxID=2654633 RepID=A0A8S1F288_9PELO|nr:unnamed protein product [Caenorhabditis bovis]